ncbi:acetyl-CoA C-acyltransferase [Methylocystis heyeri]|uniref:Acetyl-CoA C-acyltransferase n=1 Tax=Methylocystis heyeri TaxID=391905 RepID=A0A6B8KHV9_9HYPH|nr:acetyl-CoA C-acyltransferase [Methylocystis heyeri]QGM47247.1 acetyl-CoA C-acyltransferase [Methylocystis heyeri]
MVESFPVVILGAVRTPIGAFLGQFKSTPAPRLGAAAIGGVIERSKVPPESIDEVLMGCVLSAGLGQAPARQAALGAGVPDATGCVTVNKMCGSGMKAVMLAHDALRAGSARITIAGGMESMSNAPYLLGGARAGYRMGHGAITDHMFCDGLEDAYEKGRLMGSIAEDCASAYQITRQKQDNYASASQARALSAMRDGSFSKEIAPVSECGTEITLDESLLRRRTAELSELKPIFKPDGSITAASSSSISDGAAALALADAGEAERLHLEPLAAMVAHATHAGPPGRFPVAPVEAIRKLMQKAGWQIKDVDLFEINEAFAVVPLVAMQDLAIPHDKVNVHGGACALGHPIGASGARIMATLIAALSKYDLKRGIAALCIGGGEATAVAVERMT